MAFLHTMIRVVDAKKSIDFYSTLLGLELAETRRLEDCTLYFLSDKDGTAQLELTENDDTPRDGYDIGSGFGHLAFSVDNIQVFTDKLKQSGYDYLYEPFDLTGKGSCIAFVKDPDGYEVEIIEKVVW